MKKTISILGSTGSIGSNTFKIIDKKKDYFKVKLLSANKNYKLICNQISKYNPEFFIINNHTIYKKVRKKFKNKKTKILNDYEKLNFNKKFDITVSAIPGIAGLRPTIIMTKKVKEC